MDDLRGPLESRVLAVERGLGAIDRDLRRARRDLAALAQGTWDAWGDVHTGAATPAAKFPTVCPDDIPDTITIVDPNYGPCSMVYNPASKTWKGCQVVNYPGFGVCPAAMSCPITYTLFGDDTTPVWVLHVEWIGHTVGGFTCPLAGETCADAPNVLIAATATIQCHGTTTWGAAGAFIYAGNTTPNWTITLP